MKAFPIGLAIAGALLAAPSFASQSNKDDQPAKPKKVCRSEQPTGSFIAKRTCHTAEEWKAIDAANGQNAHDALDHARSQAAGTAM